MTRNNQLDHPDRRNAAGNNPLRQGERATVTGAVTDSSGQMLVGAEVSIRNTATNIFTRTKTNSAGIYYLPALPPGTYELRVEYSGFRPSVISDIPLAVGLTATFNVSLEIGAVAEAVEVKATAVQLESQTTSLGKVMQTKQISELPILGRSALQLLSTIPGVQPPAGQTVAGSGETYEVKMAGGMQTQNGVLTDGGESRAPIYTESSFTLPIESVSEFRVDTATYPAEYGRAAGGVVNMVTKSGTNQFHGVVYEFLRNDHLNANSWQNNRTGVKKKSLPAQRVRAALGGPVIRDRHSSSSTTKRNAREHLMDFVSTVPTALQRKATSPKLSTAPDESHDLRPHDHPARPEQSRPVHPRSVPWKPHSRRSNQCGVEERHELLARHQSTRRRSDALQ